MLKNREMSQYGFFAKFETQPGKRDELVAILSQAAALVGSVKGFQQYLVYKDLKNESCVCVTEIWDTKADHDNSLKAEGCMELISKAMPLMAGKPETTAMQLVGGNGL